MQALSLTDVIWLAIGLSGQALLSLRVLVRYLSRKRDRIGAIPRAFWYFSIAGGAVLLVYAIHRDDPVFIVGQTAALLFYTFNLVAIEQRRRGESVAHDNLTF